MPPKALDATWEFIKDELTEFWTRLGQDGTFSLGSDACSRYYSKVYQTFSSLRSDSRVFFYGKSRNEPGVLSLWLDGLLAQIEAELQGAQFTENTFRKIANISLIGKLAKLLFSQLDAGQAQTAEQRINESLLKGPFFRNNRGVIVEKCLESISSLRSGDVVSMQIVSSMFRLLMAPTDDATASPTTANQGLTTLGAAEITAEYIRSMEAFYTAERVKRISNPEEHNQYPKWANQMYEREVMWAKQCLSLEKGGEKEYYVGKLRQAFVDTVISSSVDDLLEGSIHGLGAQCAAYPSELVSEQLKELYRFLRRGDEYATVKSIPRLESKLGELFSERLKEAIKDYVVTGSQSHLDFSNAVGLAFEHFNSIVKECFEQYGGFTTTLRKEGKKALRKFEPDEAMKQCTLERCLSTDVDFTITGKNPEKSEDEIIERLTRISAVVAYLLTAQDSFDRSHIMLLDDRLLSTRSDEKQRKLDKKFLEIVRKDDARFDVHSANRRINDIEKSEGFVSKLGALPAKVGRILLLSSTVFSTVHQSKYGGAFTPPDGEIKDILAGIRATFLRQQPNMSLCWLNFKGVASLKAQVAGSDGKMRLQTYQMTIAQAALLLYIQQRSMSGDPVTFSHIANSCWVKDGVKSLKENLGDLMNTKKGGKPAIPLIKPSNPKFDHTTTLTTNAKFPSGNGTIDFAFKTKSSDDEELSRARVDRIKVCMVRFMKANQRADYTTLADHVVKESPKFRMPEPSTLQIKKVLDMLMSGNEQYIRRDDEDNRTFVYVA